MAGPWEKYSGGSTPAAGPWAKYTPKAEEKPAASAGELAQTALESFGNALTFGHAPQLQAAVSKLLPDPSGGVDAKMKAEGFNIQGADTSYTGERDRNIKRIAAQETENPKAALAGKIAGIANTIPLLGGMGTAAGVGGRVLQAARGGAIAGGLQNPGDVEGEVADPLEELKERGKGAAKGAAIGALVQGGADKVLSPLAGLIKGKLGTSAEQMAVKALGPTKGQLQKLKVTGKEESLGRSLLNEGVVKAGRSTNGILNRVSQKKEQIGDEIGNLIESAGDAKVVSGKVIAGNVAQADDFAMLAKTPGAGALRGRAEELINDLAAAGQMSIKDTHTMRRQVDKLINFSKSSDEMRGIQPLLYEVRSELNRAIQSVLNNSPGKAGDQLKRLNSAYSKLAESERIAEGSVARAGANQSFSLTDKIAAGAGLVSGGLPTAAALGAANKLARTYGRSTGAVALDAGSKLAGSAERGISAAAASPATRALVAKMTAPSTKFEKVEDYPILKDPKFLGIMRKNPELIQEIQDPRLQRKLREMLGRSPSGD